MSFVTGDTRGVREQLSEQMQEASRELQFERAGNFKGRIERFGKFDKPEYRFVRPLDEFRFVFIQPGGNQRQVKVFFVDRGAIAPQGVLKYPLAGEQLVKTVRRIDGFVDSRSDLEMGDVLRMGLVSRYLFSAPRRAGVILPWTGSVTVEQIAEAIESGKKLLRLKEPAKRPRDKKGGAY